ncbi:hypothetical protein EVAR_62780_1 [Eumeta japonica]|uniref:Ig-like domain-containing protein n=1 Tax=Eumeta variegata TaxID=151549 RepID=A0A4C1YZR1_EUMVA|nr:hypothetical protein EVAR_62780_1 [Eumeta japonica]
MDQSSQIKDVDKVIENLKAIFTKAVISRKRNHNKSSLSYEMRYGRITASKAHEISVCHTPDGSLVAALMGAKIPDTAAMKRGRTLEQSVRKTVSNKLKRKFTSCGLYICQEYPMIGGSPEGVTKDAIIEIKCPAKLKTKDRYLNNGVLTEKFKAQVQLQMYATAALRLEFGLLLQPGNSFKAPPRPYGLPSTGPASVVLRFVRGCEAISESCGGPLHLHKPTSHSSLHSPFHQYTSFPSPHSSLYQIFYSYPRALSCAHEITQLKVPLYADPRRAAELSCHFRMHDERLHSVKWYRDMNEIFRYNPGQTVRAHSTPSIRIFNVSGVMVQGGECELEACLVRVMPHPVAVRAAYSCEVSTEGPRFLIARETKHMTVVAMPDADPVIVGAPKVVKPGEQILLNCTSDYSLPPSEISWYIDNELQKPEVWQRTELSAPVEGGLRASWRVLRVRVPTSANESLRVRCEAVLRVEPPPVIREAVATIMVQPRTFTYNKYVSSNTVTIYSLAACNSFALRKFYKKSIYGYSMSSQLLRADALNSWELRTPKFGVQS